MTIATDTSLAGPLAPPAIPFAASHELSGTSAPPVAPLLAIKGDRLWRSACRTACQKAESLRKFLRASGRPGRSCRFAYTATVSAHATPVRDLLRTALPVPRHP